MNGGKKMRTRGPPCSLPGPLREGSALKEPARHIQPPGGTLGGPRHELRWRIVAPFTLTFQSMLRPMPRYATGARIRDLADILLEL
jgi:hypothetical protein